jgi:hypothetical protein
MRNVLMFVCLSFCFLPLASHAEDSDPIQSEILRRGDMVQHIDGDEIVCYGASEEFAEAMSPPASDADKWFVSVITTRESPLGNQLIADWRESANLQALADPASPSNSWAHWSLYYGSDRSQSWRFQEIVVNRVPTVIVQPPRTGRYGDPATVVFQGVYEGDPDVLAERIIGAIRMYLDALEPRAGDEDSTDVEDENAVVDVDAESSIVIPPLALTKEPFAYQYEEEPYDIYRDSRPPWRPAPDPNEERQPWQPFDIDVELPEINIPPIEPEVNVQIPVGAVVGGISIPTLIGIAIWAFFMWRKYRKMTGGQLLIDDATLETIIEQVKQHIEPKKPAPRKKAPVKKKTARRKTSSR